MLADLKEQVGARGVFRNCSSSGEGLIFACYFSWQVTFPVDLRHSRIHSIVIYLRPLAFCRVARSCCTSSECTEPRRKLYLHR